MQTAQPLFPDDAGDPVARFVRHRLRWNWPNLLLATLLIYGPFEKLLVPALGGYLALGGQVTEWKPDVEALVTAIVFPLFFALYLAAGPSVGRLFQSFEQNGSFRDVERYREFVQRAANAFCRRWLSVVGIVFAVSAVLVVHFFLWGDTQVEPWFGNDRTFHRVLALLLIGPVGFAVSQILLRGGLAITWLRRLWQELGSDLIIRPYHVDGAGGLGAIGRHTIAISYFLLVWTLFIVMGSFLPDLQGEDIALVHWRSFPFFPVTVYIWHPLILIQWIVFATVVILGFVNLLWPTHRAMCRARNTELNVTSKHLDRELTNAKASVDGNREALPAALEELERLKSLRKVIEKDYPTWPFSKTISRHIGFSSAVSVVNVVIAASKMLTASSS